MALQHIVSRVLVTVISRAMLLRNWLRGARRKSQRAVPVAGRAERLKLRSGNDVLDAVLVTPLQGSPRAALLLCHGIGETVDDWFAVQQLLAARGIVSLGFSYAGYGRSTGRVSAEKCERDALAAYVELRGRAAAAPMAMLGYSMGSGVVAAIAAHVPVDMLILGGAFPSLREAALSIGVPRPLAMLLPDVWKTRDTLASLRIPVLLLHGEEDRLFPVAMARELAAYGGHACQLTVIPGCSHDAPIFGPNAPFWEVVVTEVLRMPSH